MPAYVIGHRNPDTDAICSAIAYADFLQRTSMPEIVPARCGEISSRTDFILKKAGVEHPTLVMDVRPHVGQICIRNVIAAHKDDTLMEGFDRMRGSNHRSVPVLDDDRRVVGMLSMLKMVDQVLPSVGNPEVSRLVQTNLQRICRVLRGHFQNQVDLEQEQEFVLMVAALSAQTFVDRIKHYDHSRLIVVAGDRPTVQRPAIEHGVRALVITGDKELSPELLAKAKEKGVTVISSPSDTATTSLLIRCSKPVIMACQTDYMSFSEKTLVQTVQSQVQTLSEVLFPVIDDDRKLVGVFSKSDLIRPQATRLVLVDHNEFSQAIAGADQAEIIEVIDHHKLGGGLTSREPIRFVNEPLGSTCTIVARFYRQAHLEPSPAIALCMMGGIISDTLNLTSPTTTDIDREILPWLEKIARCDANQLADEFFSTGSVLQGHDATDSVRVDCKEFEQNGWKIAVSQVEEQGLDYFWQQKDKLRQAMLKLSQERSLDFACFLVTDVTAHYSVMLTVGNPRVIEAIDYPALEENLFELDGVVSRKKQLMPRLSWILDKVPKHEHS